MAAELALDLFYLPGKYFPVPSEPGAYGMNQKEKQIDWSEEYWRDMLIAPRKYAWREDTVEKLAAWLGLQPGMTVVDVGCGLGYLGYTYWPWYGKNGRYFGVDESLKLLGDAQKAAKSWAREGTTTFVRGDVHHLPLADDLADVVMCQALLMHLEKPERAVREMMRVAKQGGVVVCQEPDNVSPRVAPSYMSVPRLEIDDQLLFAKIVLLCNKGRIKLRRGDAAIGPRVPHLMAARGLVDIDTRLNDRVFYLEPPYDSPQQQHALQQVKKQTLDEQLRKIRFAREEEEFLAGGGTPEEYQRYRDMEQQYQSIFRRQVEAGEYFACGSTHFYIVKGRKPE